MENAIEIIENSPITEQLITLRSIYKFPKVRVQPTRDLKTQRFLGNVKPVDSNGDTILSLEERNSGKFFARVTDSYLLEDGCAFDLSDPMQKTVWDWVKHSPYVVGSLEEAAYTPTAEFYVYIAEKESKKSISTATIKYKAMQYIMESSLDKHYMACRLLDNRMDGVPHAQVLEFLFNIAETTPKRIIDVYTDSAMRTKLFLMDALDKGVITNTNGVFLYKTEVLGIDEDTVIFYLQEMKNKKMVELIEAETYPEFAKVEKDTKKK